MTRPGRFRSILRYLCRSNLLAFLGYVVLTLLMTYPLGLRLSTHAAGSGNDMWIFHWNNWWIREALAHGLDPYQTPYLFYPLGTGLVWHSFSWFNTCLWLPLQALVGPLAAHGITALLTYVLGGYTMYLLAREVTGSRPAAFVAGLVFAFFPIRHAHRNQLNLLSTQWIPLFALYLLRVTRSGRLRDGLKAGAALALCSLCGAQLMALGGVWAGLWLIYSLIAERSSWSRRTVLALLLAGLVCGVIVAPFFTPLVLARFDPDMAQDLAGGSVGEGAIDLLSYFVPSRYHPLLNSGAPKQAYEQWVHFRSRAATLGYTVLGLVVYAAIKRWREARFWILSASFLAVLALGTTLKVNGQMLSLPMPYRLLAPTLLGEVVRRPGRFVLVLALPLAILVAIGLANLWERLRSYRRWAGLVTVCLAALILFEYLIVQYPTAKPISSPFYAQLRREPGEFAVADFPIGFHAHDKWYMYAQTLHGRPMVGGHVSRVPTHAHDFIDSVPLLSTARTGPPEKGALDDVSRQLEPLAKADVRYVLVHKYRAGSNEVKDWRAWFGVQPYYEDEYLLVFRTAPLYGEDFQFIGEVGDGIGVVSAVLSKEVVGQGESLEVRVVWAARAAPHSEWAAHLALVGPAGKEVQSVTFEPCSGWPTSEWGRDAVAHGRGKLRVDPFIAGGTYTVTVGLLDEATGSKADQPMAVGQVEVQAVERVFEAPEMEVRSGVSFGATLRLLGYDFHQEDDQVGVTLHWQALRRMDVAYKFFVHLYDTETGALVAQEDVMPRGWTYPTTWWEAEEVVSDEIHLSLVEVPSGKYRMAVGVYHPETGDRLPVSGAEELLVSSDALILQEVAVP